MISSPLLSPPSLSLPLLSLPLLSRSIAEVSPTTKITILLVDDSESDRDSYMRYLKSDKEYLYVITEAETLEDGLELWRSLHPDVILLDINLPDGNGLELLEAMSEDPLAQQSCVIVLTGKGDEQTAVRAMKLGADDYLVKSDVTPVSLCHAVNQVHNCCITKLQLVRSQQQQEKLHENLQTYTTQLQERELESQKLSKRLGVALQSGAMGCWEWDFINNIFDWDERMYSLYAIAPQSSPPNLYDVWTNALHPDDRNKEETLLYQSILSDAQYDTEFRIIHPNLSIHFIRAYGIVLRDSDGNPEKMIGVNFDISDRKRVEEQLLRTNEELIQATRLKDEFLANMSHELRTPLTAVLGMSEIMQKEILGSVNERQQKALGAIRQGGQHLLELINDILDLSKISAGKMELNIDSTSVQNVCDSSLVYVKQQAFQKNVKIYINIAPNISNIMVDELRIRQVLINLLVNAVKFTPNGGHVCLLVSVGCKNTWQGEAKIPHQLTSQDLPLILFQVTDTGIGMALKDLQRLFQPFMQLDSGINRQYQGTGLGLVMVKKIAELHDGQVMVESVLGQGSSFTVALPYQIPETISQSSTDLFTPSLRPKTPISKSAISSLILLVEDNEANIQIFTAYLNAYDYHLIFAKNGEEAVAMAKAHQPDIILMDIQMPVMDGLEATRLIRADEKLATVPIIALTARAMQGDDERCLAVGINQYLSKPVDLDQLGEVIRQLLDGQNPHP